MNKIKVSGNLTKDAVIRYTKTNKAVCSLNIYEESKKTFLDITVWEDEAEICASLKKDDVIEVDGCVKKRSYGDKDGKKIYVTEIIAETINHGQLKEIEETKEETKDDDEGIDPFADFGANVEINDEDLPF